MTQTPHKPARHVLAALTAEPWAITEGALRMMCAIALRETDIEAVEAKLGRPLDHTYAVTMRDGVAVLPIEGPIFRHANLFSQMSGATSIDLLAKDFTQALNDSSVKAILLNIDSPGGQVDGTNEFAKMVAAARGIKPIAAYIGGTGASAAYWIASAADEIIADDTAILGSIGVIASVSNPDADTADDIQFVSSQSPNKNPDPRTDDGRGEIQTMIDSLAQVFVETVARNRGVSPDHVLSSFGKGGVMVGQKAVAAGLADRLGSFEGVIKSLSQRVSGAAPPLRMAANTTFGALADIGPAPSADAITSALSLATTEPATARVDISLPTKEIRMSEDITTPTEPTLPAAAPALPPLNPPQIAASDPAVQAQVNAVVQQMTAQFEAQRTIVLEQAQAQFQRQLAEMQAQQTIQTYAQHITTPTMQRQHALPGQASEYAAFLSGLSATQRTTAQGLFDRVLATGLISFEEIGSAGEGAAEQSAKERFDGAVSAKQSASGISKLAAIQAVQKENPALYAEYQSESRPARQAAPTKGGR